MNMLCTSSSVSDPHPNVFLQVEKEVEEEQEEMDRVITEANNSNSLWKESGATSRDKNYKGYVVQF